MLQDKVKQLSNGGLIIEILGGPEVIPALDQGTAVRKGVVDLSHVFSAAYSGLVPASVVLPLSELTPQDEESGGFNDFLREQFAKAGLYYLGRGSNSGKADIFSIIVTKKIARPQELAGLKIGAISPQPFPLLRAVGAIPLLIPEGESYVAMQTGIANGWWDIIPNFYTRKYHELGIYLLDIEHYNQNMTLIMNLDSFNRLPQNLKTVLRQAHTEMVKEWGTQYRGEVDKYKQLLIDAKMQVIKVSPEDAKWFLNNAYGAGWDDLFQREPVLAPKAKELLTKK